MSVLRSRDLPWRTYRDVRLRALATNPEAFGSNSEREMVFSNERWIERASHPGTFLWLPDDAATLAEGAAVTNGAATNRAALGDADRLDVEPESAHTPRADGIIGLISARTYLDHPDAPEVTRSFGADADRLAFVTQIWVEPAWRGAGAFDALMDAVVRHARGTGVEVIALHVYRANERAAAAYRRRGFVRTSQPHPECAPDEEEYVLPLT